MVEHVPVPEGILAADFLAATESLKRMRRGAKRNTMIALAKGERAGVWIMLEGLCLERRKFVIYRLRQDGWMIERTFPCVEGTWRWINTIDVTSPKSGLHAVHRHNALTNRAVYRLEPGFMRALRTFLGNYRASGGFIVNRWEKAWIRKPFWSMLRNLSIDAAATRV